MAFGQDLSCHAGVRAIGVVAQVAKQVTEAVDVTHSTGGRKGRTTKAIYELDGDTLKVCYSFLAEERPTEFAGKADRKSFLLVYKRVKK